MNMRIEKSIQNNNKKRRKKINKKKKKPWVFANQIWGGIAAWEKLKIKVLGKN